LRFSPSNPESNAGKLGLQHKARGNRANGWIRLQSLYERPQPARLRNSIIVDKGYGIDLGEVTHGTVAALGKSKILLIGNDSNIWKFVAEQLK
jgi:hypothetical protein